MNIKSIIKYLLPPVILVVRNKIFGKFFLPRERIEKISHLKISDSQKNKKCFILGNGPSLKNDLLLFADEFHNGVIFCVNSFPLTPEFEEFKPQYLIFADPDYSKNFIATKPERSLLVKRLISVVNWDLNIIMPDYFEKDNWFLEVAQANKFISLNYINTSPSNEPERFEQYKRGIRCPHFQTVLVKAIFNALNMGFKELFLFGVEISMHKDMWVSKHGVVNIPENHFYEEHIHREARPFWKDSSQSETFTMSEALSAFSKMHSNFEEMESYSNYIGAKIYNCSSTTYVDAFEILDFAKYDKKV
jgi:hypothetical protein